MNWYNQLDDMTYGFVSDNQEGRQKSSLIIKRYLYFLVYADSANASSDLLLNGFKIYFIVNMTHQV